MTSQTGPPIKSDDLYDLGALQQCLYEGFNEEELRDLCTYTNFWNLYENSVSARHTRRQRTEEITMGAFRHGTVNELLELIRHKNGYQYQKHIASIRKKVTTLTSDQNDTSSYGAPGIVSEPMVRISKMRTDVERLSAHVDLFEEVETLLERHRELADRLNAELQKFNEQNWGDITTYTRLTQKLIPAGKNTNSTARIYKEKLDTSSDKIMRENLQKIRKPTEKIEAVRLRLEEIVSDLIKHCDTLVLENSQENRKTIREHIVKLRRTVVQDGMVEKNVKDIHAILYGGIRFLVADLANEVGLDQKELAT